MGKFSVVKDKPSARIKSITYHKNIPLTVIWELTRRCNLNCRHCYIPQSDRKKDKELPLVRIRSILKELASMGCMHLIFTGGEIFLRDDTLQIISYARRKCGFDIRIFTNGTLIDASLAGKISSIGVSAVELSLYGPEKIHNKITRSPFSFKKTSEAIYLLKKAGVRVVVKTPFIKINFPYRRWIEKFVHKRGVVWQIDPMISLSEDGSRKNESYRLNKSDLIALHKEYSHLIADDFSPQTDGNPAAPSEKLVYCGAGRNFAAISYDGTLYPCLQLRIPLGNLLKNKFSELWHPPETASPAVRPDEKRQISIHFLRDAMLPETSVCITCQHLQYCPRCPGVALAEEGDIFATSHISCLLADARSRIF